MNNRNNDNELIEKFLTEQLSLEDQKLFAKRKEDPFFMEQLESAIIHYKGRLELKEKLQAIGKEIPSSTTNINPSVKKVPIGLLTAAASVILFFIVQFFYTKQPLPDASQLFDEHFEIAPNIYMQKGSQVENGNAMVSEAFKFYDSKQFELASKSFEALSKINHLNSPELYYYGVALLAVNNLKQSKQQFRKVGKNHPLYSDAQWYLSLALIKQDSFKKAKTLLKDNMLNFSKDRNDTAKKLLEQLEN